MTMPKASDYFHKHFPEKKLIDFLNKDLSLLFKTPKIDIGKFDGYLHEKHGDYEKQNQSMGELLEQHYGHEVKDFIEKLL